MMLKLEVAYTDKMCPIVFQGHLSNFKVTHDKILTIFTRIGHFQTVTPVWIHQWLWNVAQSLTYYRRGALFFFRGHPSSFKIIQAKKLMIRIQFQQDYFFAAIKSLRFALPELLEHFTFNSLRANFFRGNINMYLHFMSFLHTGMPKIIEILPRIRPGLTYFT